VDRPSHQKQTLMAAEIREAPDVLRLQSQHLTQPTEALVRELRRKRPEVIVTCARGSSAHAATFGKHLIERHLGIPVSAFAPNITTVYGRRLDLKGQLFLAISQAGRSEDIIESLVMARRSGALAVALVNDIESPLAKACDILLPMMAGPELSVAATKTFVASLAALLRVSAAWTDDTTLRQGLDRLPERLSLATELDWSEALPVLSGATSLITVGRGPTLAVAREAALKLKETCGIHAEAFSGAEFQHGPIALVAKSYPTLLFMPADAAAEGLRPLATDLIRKGATVFTTGSVTAGANALRTLAPDHPDADAICLIQTFYQLAIHAAQQRGTNVDRPPHLQKVTRTR
jgi:glucosamine--fructose-6-phosphate aminotransferase (isomerizing)